MNQVISITSPENLPVLENICAEMSLKANVTFYGRGTAVQSMLDLLGIESNEKRIVVSVATQDKTKAFIREQTRRLHIGVPGHGIVIAVPIKSIGGGKTVAYLKGDENTNEKYVPPTSYAYELIVVIASEGNTDLVMNAARSAGARGGTVLHGKGTSANGDQKFYNISIAQEKEVILIVASSETKNGIMRAILKTAGPETPAQAIVFSTPISEVAGFGLFSDNAP